MTRAEKWLIVAAAGDLGGEHPSWYEQVADGMERAGAYDQIFDNGIGKRVSFGDWEGLVSKPLDVSEDQLIHWPDWYTAKPKPPAEEEYIVTPSDLGGAKALPGDQFEDEDIALRRGMQVHLLLETLPKISVAERKSYAETILKSNALIEVGENIIPVINEALSVLNDEELSFVFAPDALAEVPISVRLPIMNNCMMNGTIDRLIVKKKDVWVIDFKTNRKVPQWCHEVPLGILRQMGAYTAALIDIYPDHQIKPCILWTATPSLMQLDPDHVMNALSATVNA